ncbi:ergothioneine biosynthesis protein EgtB [Anthocerotibacter panamensis]|uniref:ergothioneine biosynthesis protein EgtB n=1 Tax=Anthocerotibacter panamensis TaxID=2857077 RepID=UPI001C40690F|nr:ergothioneine biosynthesis protein EgtB [Anthocerotibacter panamensis]
MLAATGQALSTRSQAQKDYHSVRALSEQLCLPLAIEDYVIQSMPDVSPPKWHLAHTTWFFETFLLAPWLPGYTLFHPQFGYLFNSYYEAVGVRYPRHQRGLISRPTVEEVYRYRYYVDQAMGALLADCSAALWPKLADLLTLGLHHEQQHQELLLMDIKHILATNPLRPVYRPQTPQILTGVAPLPWQTYPAGIREMGWEGPGFHFDNEGPRHRVFLEEYQLAQRLVTNGEYLAFMADDGYARPELWLAEGWSTTQQTHWQAPLYWEQVAGEWWQMTLAGMRQVVEYEPVCHLSYYEADAYARWAGKCLPTEAQWEAAIQGFTLAGNLLDSGVLHPAPAAPGTQQWFGDVWEWTQSAYQPYPGYRPNPGALGEYNGKFMCNQYVLRGGCCVTPADHLRLTYRNFFPASARWPFTGLRLAEDVTS